MTGKTAENLVIKVPPGTIIAEDQTDHLLGTWWKPDSA
jgi:GTPase involved in cell partitioning and DNA repair